VVEAQRLLHVFIAAPTAAEGAVAAKAYLRHYSRRVEDLGNQVDIAAMYDSTSPPWAWPESYGPGFGRTALLERICERLSDLVPEMQEYIASYKETLALPVREKRYFRKGHTFKLGEIARIKLSQ
jgi:hypothetical protein